MYAKVYCKGKTAPLKLSFKYKTKGDLKMYCSYHSLKPNAIDSHYQYKKVNKIQLWSEDQREHTFQNSFIYLSLFSNNGIVISVKAEFEDDKSSKKGNKNLFISTGSDNENDFFPDPQNDGFRYHSTEMLKKSKTPSVKIKDFIEENKKLAG